MPTPIWNISLQIKKAIYWNSKNSRSKERLFFFAPAAKSLQWQILIFKHQYKTDETFP
jgi:hypothetical protein